MPLIQGFEELNLNVALLGSANVFGIALQESKLRDGVESVSTGYLLVVFLLTKICFSPATVLPALVPVSASLGLSLHLSPTFRLSCVSFYLQLCWLRW